MTSFSFIDKFTLTTDSDTNKNFESDSFNFSVPATTVAAQSYQVRSFTVPLSTTTRSYQLMINMSDLDDRYYAPDNFDRMESVGSFLRGRAVVVSASGGVSTVSVYFYFNAPTGSTTFPAFTLNIIRRDFVDGF